MCESDAFVDADSSQKTQSVREMGMDDHHLAAVTRLALFRSSATCTCSSRVQHLKQLGSSAPLLSSSSACSLCFSTMPSFAVSQRVCSDACRHRVCVVRGLDEQSARKLALPPSPPNAVVQSVGGCQFQLSVPFCPSWRLHFAPRRAV